MDAIVLVKHGSADGSVETRSMPVPVPNDREILIRVEGFGLNYADVLARRGLYPDCPKLPTVLGYEVVGVVHRVGAAVSRFEVGQRVLALTRFGGYAQFVTTDQGGCVAIGEQFDLTKALALATQYCTAYYCAEELVRLHEGDHVLIHAAAGGVGTALVQLAKRRKCIVYGTASSAKLEHLVRMGVDHPIDYRKVGFAKSVSRLVGERGLDVIFDPVGGSSSRRGFKLLGAGGRLVLFGISAMSNATNVLGRARVAAGFGLFHPIQLLGGSKSVLGVNMLQIGDHRPWLITRILETVAALAEAGALDPVVAGTFDAEDIGEAHRLLESRESIGKIGVRI